MAASDKSVVVSSTTDFSSDSTVSDDWQELTKSDYAKVIFSDLLCNAASGTVECKFQITDNVHEDPNDYVGLFRIGYEDLSQCLVSKMLSQTKCEDDGKLQRCVFTAKELPCLTDGFYQFLYVTRDQEVCGASMPFQIKIPSPSKESSVDSSASENMDGGFLLVSNEMEKKVEEPSVQEKASVQQSTLSEQKKEEIAAWVSQNPDYYSLIEQIREHTFTIDALQQSKDLAMREVAQLYEILNRQNAEMSQMKNMLGAYEEKVKMSISLQDEKNIQLIQMKSMLDTSNRKRCRIEEEKNVAISSMRKSLGEYEEKIKSYELLQKEKEEELSRMKREFHVQEEKLKTTLSFQDQQRVKIDDLKRELEETKEMQKANECQQVAAEGGSPSLDTLIQKAKDLVHFVSDINNLDFTDENVEKLYQLKIQMLIMLRKVSLACDPTYTGIPSRVNEIGQACSTSSAPQNIEPVENVAATSNTPEVENQACSTSSAVQNKESVETVDVTTSTPEVEKTIPTTSSSESPSLPSSSRKEPTKEDASKEVSPRGSFNKAFESEVLEHQIIELPRLDVISEDTAKTLQTDKPLDTEDVTVINRLTEKIIRRGFNLYEAIEIVDDSVSDSESDVSEISECSSSIKKDILCVSRVMDALSSYLSNQTSLDHLIVVEKEEDRSLIHRNKWDVLLQKCALRYQIELLLEHIEKQKEGIKKVSEKICDLLTKYMLLKDEVAESKAHCVKLQSIIVKKDMLISKLKGELNFKNTLLGHFRSKNEELESKTELAEKTVEDFRARIEEASHLYKKQYTEIERLSKKLRKYKSVKDKTKSSKGESSLISSDNSSTASSFEVVKKDSVQNINDSDTGEHMFEKSSLVSKKKNQDSKASTVDCFPAEPHLCNSNVLVSLINKPTCSFSTEAHIVKDKETQVQVDSNTELKTVPETCLTLPTSASDDVLPSNPELKSGESVAQAVDEEPNTETVECRSHETASLFSDFASYEQFQEVIKESFVNIKRPNASRNSQECSISCYVCKEIIHLQPENPIDLMNHLENEHSMKMCPVCGQLFEDAIPPRYFHIHVEQHFETQ